MRYNATEHRGHVTQFTKTGIARGIQAYIVVTPGILIVWGTDHVSIMETYVTEGPRAIALLLGNNVSGNRATLANSIGKIHASAVPTM